MSRASPSSPPHSVAGALFLARQWPVQLSPVPGGIIDPQTVQTTTSAWNQAKGNEALENSSGCTRDRKGHILTAEAWQQSCKCHTFASPCTPFGQSSFNHPEKHPNRRNIPVMQRSEICFLWILMFYILIQKHQMHAYLENHF